MPRCPTSRPRRTLGPPCVPAAGLVAGAGYADRPSDVIQVLLGGSLREEWRVILTAGGSYGELDWTLAAIAGAAPTLTAIAPGTAREIGVARLAHAGTNANDGGVLYLPAQSYTGIPTGWVFLVKLRLQTTTNIDVFTGMVASATPTVFPTNAAATSAVGIRAIVGAGAANWYAVAKTGAAAETTLDTGLAAGGTWRIFGLIYKAANVLEVYSIDASSALLGPVWTYIGTIGANIPAGGLSPCAAALICPAGGAVAKSLDQDFWALGGPVGR